MKRLMKKIACGLTCLLLMSAALMAKDPGNQSVDSGAFGIFINNRRVATETFSVQQQSNGNSTITSQIKDDGGIRSAKQRTTIDFRRIAGEL